VFLKADSGPGRMATEFLAETADEGMYFFPGLPNATEIGEEMDQLFAAFKTCTYKNRDKLYGARVSGDVRMLYFCLKMLGTLSLVARSNCQMAPRWNWSQHSLNISLRNMSKQLERSVGIFRQLETR
jgi:hypothetical protein